MLVRVGIDQAFGNWNAPVDPETNEFVYVPIPDSVAFQPGLETPYAPLRETLREFAAARACDREDKVLLPEALARANMHLDPDFDCLTYGDNGNRRGKGITELGAGDLVVFYAGLRPVRRCAHRLLYAIIGLFRVGEVVRLRDVARQDWAHNAHTRRLTHHADDVIVRAIPGESGRLRRCLPIGEWRSRAYRVRSDLLRAWGGLSCNDGYIQRSAVPPMFLEPAKFLAWFEAQAPELLAANNPGEPPRRRAQAIKRQPAKIVTAKSEPLARTAHVQRKRKKDALATAPVVIVVLRQPGRVDRRTDPLYEFGSFGLTGCHGGNLLNDDAAAGCRLAFAQGGPDGFRLVMLTPPIDVREVGDRHEAFWPSPEMPLRYEAAPILIDNDGRSDVAGLHAQLAGVRRSTWVARFASSFRSREKPLSVAMGGSIIAAWELAARDPKARATAYWQALPKKPTPVDTNRRSTYRQLRDRATGGKAPRRCR